MLRKILILIATHNGERHIAEQLKSIINQKKVTIDVLVSDDQSSDKTIDVLKSYESEINIKFLNRKKSKNITGSAQNFYDLISGSDAADYDFIAYSDQDDIFIDTKYIEMIKLLENTDYIGGSSYVKCFGEYKNILTQSNNITKYDYLFEGAGQGNTFVLKKEFFIEFQAFVKENRVEINNFFYHDWLTYLFCRSKGYSWFFDKNPRTLYRIHQSNITGSKRNLKGVTMRLKKLFDGWYYEQVLIANRLARIINSDTIDLENISISRLIYILLSNGRRKLSDRFLAFIGIIFSRITSKI